MPILVLIIVLIAAWDFNPWAGILVFAMWFGAIVFGKLRVGDADCDDCKDKDRELQTLREQNLQLQSQLTELRRATVDRKVN